MFLFFLPKYVLSSLENKPLLRPPTRGEGANLKKSNTGRICNSILSFVDYKLNYFHAVMSQYYFEEIKQKVFVHLLNFIQDGAKVEDNK